MELGLLNQVVGFVVTPGIDFEPSMEYVTLSSFDESLYPWIETGPQKMRYVAYEMISVHSTESTPNHGEIDGT